jgi:thioredoxin
MNTTAPVQTEAEAITFADFQTLTTTKDIAIIDFWATWCGPCKNMSPIVDSLTKDEDFAGVRIFKVDVDDQPELSQAFEIRAMPTFFAVQFDGEGSYKVLLKIVGAQDGLTFKQNMLEAISPVLSA